MASFAQALFLGLAYAMPLGPQNLFVIHSAVGQGLPRSLRTALIVSLIDFSLALACFWGVGLLIEKYQLIKMAMIAGGSIFLVYYGIKLLKSRVQVEEVKSDTFSPIAGILRNAFILTWFNPQALVDGTLLFGGYRASLASSSVIPFIGGFAVASPLWFFTITAIVGSIHHLLPREFFTILNRICGSILLVYSIKLIYQLVIMVA